MKLINVFTSFLGALTAQVLVEIVRYLYARFKQSIGEKSFEKNDVGP